tara:strand:+ start:17237 stop:18511 length:1275 start_codon:yes stop_codon:yes gene_type:complete
MNMQSKKPITAAEQLLVDSFVENVGNLPGDGGILTIRDGYIEDIKQNGLPTRRVESWHYTDLRNLLKTVPSNGKVTDVEPLDSLIAGSNVMSVVDGHTGNIADLPGVSATSYRNDLSDGSAADHMALRNSDDLIGRVNGAFVTDGIKLQVEDDVVLDNPLEIQVLHNGGQAHTRFPVAIGKGVKGLFVERHAFCSDDEALVSSITDLDVGEGADVVWVINQEQGASDTHLGQINIRLGADAKLLLFVANAGGKLVRQEIHIVARGEGSELTLRGVNLLGDESHTDVTMTLEHIVPNCVSGQIFRNVVLDRAKGVFQGQIKVAQIAQKTDAKMACNTLLLSDFCDFSAKPELEIFADDVQCGHGATVTDIDKNQLFYLKARGIGEKRARSLLVKAFIVEVVEELDNEVLIEALEKQFETWLNNHG